MALSSALIDCMDAWFHIASYMSPKPQSQSAVSDTAHVVALLLVLAELYAHGVRLGLPETQTASRDQTLCPTLWHCQLDEPAACEANRAQGRFMDYRNDIYTLQRKAIPRTASGPPCIPQWV